MGVSHREDTSTLSSTTVSQTDQHGHRLFFPQTTQAAKRQTSRHCHCYSLHEKGFFKRNTVLITLKQMNAENDRSNGGLIGRFTDLFIYL